MMQIHSAKTTRPALRTIGTALLFALLAACGSSDDGTSNPNGGASSSGGGTGPTGPTGPGGLPANGGKGDGKLTPNGDILPVKGSVNLGMAGNFVILAKSGVSTVPSSAVTGNIGVSPVAASYITGFSLTADATNAFSTSPQVAGSVFASDYALPTPSNLTTAVADMEIAFTDAAGRAPTVTELGAGDVGGMTLTAGVYKWSSGLLIPTDLTLKGSAAEVWIFQIAQGLTMASDININLTGGALPKNVFWQVAGAVEIGTKARFAGVLLAATSISFRTGASITGRLLAQTAVTIDGSTVVAPAP